VAFRHRRDAEHTEAAEDEADQPPPSVLLGRAPDEEQRPVRRQDRKDVADRPDHATHSDGEKAPEWPSGAQPQPEDRQRGKDQQSDSHHLRGARGEMDGGAPSHGPDHPGAFTATSTASTRSRPLRRASHLRCLGRRPLPRQAAATPLDPYTSMITGTITGFRCVISKKY